MEDTLEANQGQQEVNRAVDNILCNEWLNFANKLGSANAPCCVK